MAALTSGSWTVRLLHATGVGQNGAVLGIDQDRGRRQKVVNAIMTLTTGEQSANGVPWPAPGSFGFYRNLDAIILQNTYPWSTATFPANTVSGKQIWAQSNATAGKIKFLAITQATGATLRSFKALSTALTLNGGLKLYVTARGW